MQTPSRRADLGAVRSMYYRRPSGFAFPHLDKQDERFAVAQARYGLGGILTSLPGCLYVNHPNRIGDAEYKPAGLAAAAAAGFTLPPTLITNVPDDARAFIKAHGPAIFKPISVPLYLVDGKAQTVPVTEVAADEIDDSVTGTMHLFQKRVDKVADIRVTVIGEQIFAVRIDSGLLDWRTDYGTHTYTPLAAPPAVERSMHAYLKHFGLVFGAFDFALTDSRRVDLHRVQSFRAVGMDGAADRSADDCGTRRSSGRRTPWPVSPISRRLRSISDAGSPGNWRRTAAALT